MLLWALALLTKLCELLRGGLADVGVVGGTVYPSCKVLVLLKDCVSVIRLLKHHVVRETKRRPSSLVGKSAQTSTECTN